VESLMAQQNQKRVTHEMDFNFKDGDAKMKPNKIEKFSRDENPEAAEQAKRADEKAAKQRERGRAEAQMKEASERELEALRRARESLQREMEKLDRQIERLQQGRKAAVLELQQNGAIAVNVQPVPQATLELTPDVGVQSRIAVDVKPVPQAR